MASLSSVEIVENIGVIKIHAGKVNAFSHELIEELHLGFDQLKENPNVKSVVLTGQEGIFSAGFDLKVMRAGPEQMNALVKAGGELLVKLYLYEKPLIIGASGHTMAMGAITLMVGDVRIGLEGEYKLGLNETSIGMALPKLAIAFAKDRLVNTMITRAVIIGEIFDPKGAVKVGYLDLVAPPEAFQDTLMTYAKQLGESVELNAFAENKRRIRAATLESVKDIWD